MPKVDKIKNHGGTARVYISKRLYPVSRCIGCSLTVYRCNSTGCNNTKEVGWREIAR